MLMPKAASFPVARYRRRLEQDLDAETRHVADTLDRICDPLVIGEPKTALYRRIAARAHTVSNTQPATTDPNAAVP
jgi:hypothetical protein